MHFLARNNSKLKITILALTYIKES
jgi:hypothetical protein